MSRRMSCSITVDAVRERRKTVTRRHVDTWRTLKAGDRLTLIEKGMGLPKGAKQVVLAEVEIVDVRVEQLWDLDAPDVIAEGFPDMDGDDFAVMWLKAHGYGNARLSRGALKLEMLDTPVRRIEWRYLR